MKTQNISKLKPQVSSRQKLSNQLKKASQLYEKQFLRQMVKAMRGTVKHGSFTQPTMAEKIYSEQLDDRYVDKWVETGGTGLSEVIFQDLVNKFFPQLNLKKKGPVRPLNLSDNVQKMVPVVRSKSSPHHGGSSLQYRLEMGGAPGESSLKMPWPGKVQSVKDLGKDMRQVELTHPWGLSSTLVFQGEVSTEPLGKNLLVGEKFAQLKSNAREILWKISNDSTETATEDGDSFFY